MTGRRERVMTMADIARLANVSVPTVSKVLNGRANVARRTRLRVEEVIQANGYRHPRRHDGYNHLVELIFHRLDDQWPWEILEGVQSFASARGYGVVLTERKDDGRPEPSWMDAVFSRRSAAVVSVGADLSEEERDALSARSIPVVPIDPERGPVRGRPSVSATNWSGGHAAAQHLLELGHRRIGVVAGPAGRDRARAWLDGYRAALDSAGVPVLRPIRSGAFLVRDGHRLGRELLNRDDPPTAIMTAGDLQAVGVYHAAGELGLRIPRDLSVVGCDDLEVAGWVGPRLTTVHQPLKEMAARATELALDLAAGGRSVLSRIEVPTRLVVRESSAPPRPGPQRGTEAAGSG